MACKWVRFAYRVLPMPGWRTFLLDRHIDGCPSCQSAALDGQEIRFLGVTLAALEGELPLTPFAAAFSAPARRRTFRFGWGYAFGFFLAAAILWAALAITRLVPQGTLPQGTVTITEADAEATVFAVIEARIGDEPAWPVIFKPGQPGLTIVWFEKSKN